jgi:hypothetical protein
LTILWDWRLFTSAAGRGLGAEVLVEALEDEGLALLGFVDVIKWGILEMELGKVKKNQ